MQTKQHQQRGVEAVIIGAGLCGMMMALYLARRGYVVEIFEKANDAMLHAMPSNRATELDLSARAMLALSELGLQKKVQTRAVPTTDRVIFFPDKSHVVIDHCSVSHDVIYNISRSDLYMILYRAVQDEPGINIHFAHQLVMADVKNNLFVFDKNHGESVIQKYSTMVLACDGVNSIVRRALNDHALSPKNYTHLYKEMTLPAAYARRELRPTSMAKWVGQRAAFLAHPRKSSGFGGTLVLPYANENDFSKIFTHDNFPKFEGITGHLSREFSEQPFGKLRSTKVDCQHKNGVLLLGDAAHGMLPFLGQGINAAFEDCRIFNMYLQAHQDNWPAAAGSYVAARQRDTDAIIAMSEIEYQEFESGSSLNKIKFDYHLQAQFSQRYPEDFYSYRQLLAFSHLPYSEVMQHQRSQRQLFNLIHERFKRIENIRWEMVDAWMECGDRNDMTMQYGCL